MIQTFSDLQFFFGGGADSLRFGVGYRIVSHFVNSLTLSFAVKQDVNK